MAARMARTIGPVTATSANWKVMARACRTTRAPILISCSRDPCAAAAALKDIGIATKIHMVGFDLTAEQRAKIQCISDNGNGKYFDAKDNSELVAALDQGQAKVVVPKPIKIAVTPPKPKLPPAPKVYFRDNFDGKALGEHWTVNNKDPEDYIVEDGGLTVLFSDSKKPTNRLKDAKTSSTEQANPERQLDYDNPL